MLASLKLNPLLCTPKKRDAAIAAAKAITEKAGRKYVFEQKPQTDFPATPRDPGIQNNTPRIQNRLLCYALFGDKVALQSAVNHGRWLAENYEEHDRAHCHPMGWWPCLAAAAEEAGIPLGFDALAYFERWRSEIAGDPYLIGFAGSTFRPLIRLLGAAVHTEWVAQALGKKQIGSGIKALAQLVNWSYATDPKRGHWLHDVARPKWDQFPYMDGQTWASHSDNFTLFMGGAIAGYEGMMLELCAPPVNEHVEYRFKQLTRHAVAWGYDYDSGFNAKAIGKSKPGCYRPPYSGSAALGLAALNDLSGSDVQRFGENGYHDFSLALLAAADSKDEAWPQIIAWASKCRAIEPGQWPICLTYAAMKCLA